MTRLDHIIPIVCVVILALVGTALISHQIGYDKGYDTDAYQIGVESTKMELINTIVNECEHAPSPIFFNDTSFILVRYHRTDHDYWF